MQVLLGTNNINEWEASKFMRIRVLMLSSLVLLAFFAINAFSIKWDAPGSQSVDQMFAGDNRSTSAVSGITRDVKIGSFSSGSSGTESTPISGKWSMEFNYGSPPKATLNLFQDGDVVYGTGVLILDPKTNLEVAAGGTVMGDKMNLDMISMGNVSLYSISMTVIGNSASGTYTAYRPGASPSGGPANAIRSPTRS
jgi:hypothetical protein